MSWCITIFLNCKIRDILLAINNDLNTAVEASNKCKRDLFFMGIESLFNGLTPILQIANLLQISDNKTSRFIFESCKFYLKLQF